ncbi:acid phosphatase 1-like [Telopea speciosissima]|uniref:acid phosphatase 1-like n=1 Tax=Telopea speciosissima TaxID=54955 RepID=UPI001CC48A6E|nr:acid phosphatase 1-like [Telopea speciosissima]
MNRRLGVFLLLGLFSIASAEEKFDSQLLPRPLILEYPETHEIQLKGSEDDEQQLQCTSWRFAVEANNLNPWKTVPLECAGYVKDYMTSKAYRFDLERVSMEAGSYARSLQLAGDGMDAWVFDIDETLLSNIPYYSDHGFGLEVFDSREFDKWVQNAAAPAIELSLKLYDEVLGFGFKVFLLTGRSESQRTVTVENLRNAGFRDWDKLILRALEDHGKTATLYKSEKRSEMVKEGYRILGNSGDQWSDLLGDCMSNRSFKLPNPMYYIP